MYLIGIDVSKYKHDCFIMTKDGEVVKDSFVFSNDINGFNSLISLLSKLDQTLDIKIGLESTSHYGVNLKNYLNKNGFHFAEFNPYLVKKFNQAKSMRKTKTDKLDAKVIAQMLNYVDYKTYIHNHSTYTLKTLTRFRDRLVKQRSYQLVQLTNVLDICFPEFKPFFGDKFTTTALYILKRYKTTDKISRINKTHGFENLKNLSRGRLNYPKFLKLIELAKNSIGLSDEAFEYQIETLILMIELLEQQIKSVEQRIEKITLDINPPTLSIKGIGTQSAAVIISEFGNFSNFDKASKLVSFAGIDSSISQSGTQSHTGHMVKRGSGYLRQTLMNLVNPLLLHNPVLSQYYYKKRSEGKSHRVASTHVVRKLLRIIYHLETNNLYYDPSLIR